jgi:TPP-dependent pyruvate/acetoin dehydrogenase alpha subunit
MEDEKEIVQPQEEVKQNAEENPIEEAKRILAETNEALLKITEERKKIERATAESLVNGRSYAGQSPKPPVEESPAEYKKRIMGN